jgi:hypothetical protein
MCPGRPPRDADGDGVPDNVDNCPDDFNPDQLDGDGDQRGDACESESRFSWALIIDSSAEENMNGTPGADICGATAFCGRRALSAVAALLNPGDGELCDSVREGCPANRADPSAAQDDGSACEPASAPSDYVSLGMSGFLGLDFGQDLQGCVLEVVELVGNQEEGYEVYVCEDVDASSDCLNNGSALGFSRQGGTIEVLIP